MRESTKWLAGNFGVAVHWAAFLLMQISFGCLILCLLSRARQDFSGLSKCFFWKHLPLETRTAGRSRPFVASQASLAVGHAAQRLRIGPIVHQETVAVGHLHLRH